MSKKKLGIFIEWYLPGTKAGGPTRSIYSLISVLKNKFDIYILTTNTDLGSSEAYPNIKSNEWFTDNEINYYYFSKTNINASSITAVIKNLNPDVVYLNSFWSYWFSIFIIKLKNKRTFTAPITLAPRGMLGKGARNIKARKKNLFLFISKTSKLYKNIHFHATNQQELEDIKSEFKHATVTVIENVNNATPIQKNREKIQNQLDIFFLSRISKVKNLHYALNSLANIPSEITINYTIYGNIEDLAYWEKCKTIIKMLPSNIHVHYKGELPFHLIQENIAQHHALFLPTLNENFGHSIVESLMSGCIAIISNQTPWNDLEKNNAGYALNLNNEALVKTTLIKCAQMTQLEFEEKSKASIAYISKKIDLNLTQEKYIQLFNA